MTTIHVEELHGVAQQFLEIGWPWQQVGVFPTNPESAAYDHFNYTVGLGDAEMRVSCVSIEGRHMPNDLAGGILNRLCAGWVRGLIGYGDTVIVPLGIVGDNKEWERDADGVFWIGSDALPARELACFASDAEWAVPVIWSSPMGWPE
jgi:hypothetical protein